MLRWHNLDMIDLWQAPAETRLQMLEQLKRECLQAAVRDYRIHDTRRQAREAAAQAVVPDPEHVITARWRDLGWNTDEHRRETDRERQRARYRIIAAAKRGTAA